MVRHAFYQPRRTTIDAEHDEESMSHPDDQLEEGLTKMDSIIKFLIVLTISVMVVSMILEFV